MRASFRWTAGLVTLVVGVGIILLPGTSIQPKHVTAYIFGGFLLLCAFVCAIPYRPAFRIISAGISVLCLTLCGFILVGAYHQSTLLQPLDAVAGLFLTAIIGFATVVYTVRGKLPRWRIVHRWLSDHR